MINIITDSKRFEQLRSFWYLGVLIIVDGGREAEVRLRIGLTKEVLTKKMELMTGNMSIKGHRNSDTE